MSPQYRLCICRNRLLIIHCSITNFAKWSVCAIWCCGCVDGVFTEVINCDGSWAMDNGWTLA